MKTMRREKKIARNKCIYNKKALIIIIKASWYCLQNVSFFLSFLYFCVSLPPPRLGSPMRGWKLS